MGKVLGSIPRVSIKFLGFAISRENFVLSKSLARAFVGN